MRRLALPFAVVLMIGLPAMAPDMAQAQSLRETDGFRVETVLFACDAVIDDLSVAFFNTADGHSFAAFQIGGTTRALVQEPAASGALYADIDRAGGFDIHTKGDDLLLSRASAPEEAPLARCVARR